VAAKKVNIIVFSGEMDKALAAFNIAVGGASMGMDVTMFFTFWGLNVIKKNEGSIRSKGVMRKMLNFMNRGGSKRLPLSKFHMFGMGKWMMGKLMTPGSADASARRADRSSRLRAARASPLAQRAMAARASSATCSEFFPSPRSGSLSARSRIRRISASDSGCRTRTLVRESRGAITSKEGFSVVAPIRVMVPRST